MKYVLSCLAFIVGSSVLWSQTEADLKNIREQKKDSMELLKAQIEDIDKQLAEVKGWEFGAIGTAGLSISQFSNWYAQGSPNVNSGKIGITFNGYANLEKEKYFWRNSTNINLQWIKFDDKDDPDDEEGYREATDVFNINSLFGYKVWEKVALSAMGEYRSTILSNFNDPGYLDIGAGFTWTPVKGELIVVVHPLNYNFVFSDEGDIFNSSGGTKVLVDYIKTLNAWKIKSNFTAFMSYKSSNLSSWTWTNTLGYSLWKSVGLGLEFGLRDNKQEALNYAVNTKGDATATFDSINNELQSYWLFGVNYNF